MRAAEIAGADAAEQRSYLNAVLRCIGGMDAGDGVVVNVGGQPGPVDENAVFLKTADGRVLDLDRVRTVAAVGGVVAGGEDAVIALDAGDVRAGERSEE